MEECWQEFGIGPAPSLAQIERQKRWEVSAVEDAITQYRADAYEKVEHSDGTTSRRVKQLADTALGPKLMREILGDDKTYGVGLAFRQLRQEIIDNITNGRQGRRPEWYYIVADRDPLELAVITIRALLSVRFTIAHEPLTMTGAAGHVAELVKDQYEMDGWREESKARAKETGEKDLAKILLASVKGRVDRKTYHRWRKKVSEIQRLHWPIHVKRQLGVALIQTAVDACGGWFEIVLLRQGRKTTRYVRLTEKAATAIHTIQEEQSILRPRHNPMLCPPMPWRSSEEKEAA